MDLNEIAIFVKVVELGSFIGAANDLNMPKSTVSSKVSSLEERLGVTLIQRTTRKLHITDVGYEYYQHCLQAIAQISEAEKQVSQDQSIPSGLLRLTTTVEIGTSLLPNIIIEFKKKYPKVELDIILTDRNVDFVSERIDLAIRVGELKDSSLVAKKLGSIYFAPFASAKYLKDHLEIKNPKDMENHAAIIFTPFGQKWELKSTNQNSQVVRVNSITETNDLTLIKSLAMAGLGITMLPTFTCLAELKNGKLVRVLKKWRTDDRPVHFIYPAQKYVSPKTRAFIDTTEELIKSHLKSAQD